MELIKPYLAAIIIILLSFNSQAATVSVSPPSQSTIEGNNFKVSVYLETEGSSVHGVQFSLIFDKAKINALRIDEGALLKSDGALTIPGVNKIDNSTGKITYSLARNTRTGISSSGTIAEITFRGLSAGTAPLNFANVVISDPNASEIPSSTQAGSVTVAAVSTPTATPTSTPTATATATATPTTTPTATTTATVTPTTTPTATVTGSTQTSSGGSGSRSKQSSTSQDSASQAAASTIDKLELVYPDNTLITLSSASGVSEGDEFIVNAYIKSTEPVYGAEMKLLFDINYLEGIRIERGDFLGGSMIVNSVNNENGEMVYAETKVGNVTGVKAKGVLARAMFRAKKAGNTSIGLKNVKLINENEAAISDVLSESASLNISRKAEESRKLESLAVYWALIAFICLVIVKRRRSRF